METQVAQPTPPASNISKSLGERSKIWLSIGTFITMIVAVLGIGISIGYQLSALRKIDSIEAKIDAIENNITGIRINQASVHEKINGVEKTLIRIEAKVFE